MHGRWCDVVDGDAGAGLATAAVLIGDGNGDGVVAGAEVLVAYPAEAQRAGGQADCRIGAAVAPVDDHCAGVERTRIGERTAQRGRAVLADGGGAERQLHIGRCDVIDGDAAAGLAAAAVLIGHGDGDGVVAGAEVLVVDIAEAEHSGGQVERVTAAVAPGDDDSVRIQRTGISEGSAERGRAILVDRGRAQAQLHVRRSKVADSHSGAGLAAGVVLIGDGNGDGEAAVVEVLVAYPTEAENAGGQVERGIGAAVAPGDDDGVRIQRTGIGKRTAQRSRAVLIASGRAERQLHIGWCDINDGNAGAGLAAAAILVGDGNGLGVAAVVEVLVAGTAESQNAGGQVECGIGAAVAPGDDDGVRVQRSGIGERTAQRSRAVLVDSGGAEA